MTTLRPLISAKVRSTDPGFWTRLGKLYSSLVFKPDAEPNADDVNRLNEIFKKDVAPAAPSGTSITEEELDRIADRVIQKLSTQIIENIAWDVVPDITEKIVREELKKNER